jgi:glutamine amidotransferase
MIALVDYGMGNLRSVEKALARVGANVRIVNDRDSVIEAEALVVPGVGAFGDCMKKLEKLDLVGAIREYIDTGRPFLGICLGMQGLFLSSEESPGVKGLAVFEGVVPRFHFGNGKVNLRVCEQTQAQAGTPVPPRAGGLKVPHMGWNQLRIRQRGCPLLQNVENGSYVYFVHSYYCQPGDDKLVCATTEYGLEFCSMLWAGNVFATQFHPEKSQTVGLKMLENFVRMAGKSGDRRQKSG